MDETQAASGALACLAEQEDELSQEALVQSFIWTYPLSLHAFYLDLLCIFMNPPWKILHKK